MTDSSQPTLQPKLQSIPPQLTCVADYEAVAHQFVDHPTLEYIQGGSGDERSLRDNRQAFDDWQLVNRLLVDCTHGSTRSTLLGQALRHPFLLAPVAYQKLVHPDGERETARGADALEAGLVTSTLASCPLEDIAALHGGLRWFQLYFQPQRAATLELVRRAEACGYSAIMVTLDASIQATNRRAQRAGFVFPREVAAVNVPPNRPTHTDQPPVALTPDQSAIFQGAMKQAPGWQDLEWLLQSTELPVLVKGVMHPDDARRLMALNVSGRRLQGLVVSNHGGRALDGVPSPLRVLADLRLAVGDQVPLLMDGGIRSGYDAFKALALGANAVMIGRPQLYGLAVAGALGVAHILRILRDELELCMALAGCPTLASIGPHCLLSKNTSGAHAPC